jgi:hypothetical protein
MQDPVTTAPEAKPRTLELVDNQTGNTVDVDWYEHPDPTEEDIAEIFEQSRAQRKAVAPAEKLSVPTFTGEPSMFGGEIAISAPREPVKPEEEQQTGLLTFRAKSFLDEIRRVNQLPEYQELEKAMTAIERKQAESPAWQNFVSKTNEFNQLDEEIGFSKTQELIEQANKTLDPSIIQEARARIAATPKYQEALNRAQELIRMQAEDRQIKEILTDQGALAATSAQRKDVLQYASDLRKEYGKIPQELRELVETKETALMLKKYAREALKEVNQRLETADYTLSVPGSTRFGGAAGLYPTQQVVDRQSLQTAKNFLEDVENYRLDTGADALDLLRGISDRAKAENLPFLGSLVQMASLNQVRRIANKPADQRTKPENLLLEAYSISRNIESLPGMGSMLYQAGRQVTDMFAYMVEFIATGGVYTAGKRLAAKGTLTLLGKEAFGTIMRAKGMEQVVDVLKRAGLKATWATIGGTTQGLVNAQRIGANFTERTLPYLKLADTTSGQILSQELARTDDSVITSMLKSIGTTASDFVTERWGIVVAKPIDFIKRQAVGRYIARAGIRTADDAREAVRKGIAWQGLFPEWFEEWAQMPIQTTIEEGKPRLMTPTEMLQTAIVVGVPSGLDVVTSLAAKAADQRSYRKTQAEIASARYTTEKAIERMMSAENVRTAAELGVEPKMMPEFKDILAAQISDRSAESRDVVDLIKESGESVARFDSDYRSFLEQQGVSDQKINSFESLIDLVEIARKAGMGEEELQLIARERELDDQARLGRAQDRILQEKQQYRMFKELKAVPRSTFQPIENIPEMPTSIEEMREQLQALVPEHELVRMSADELRRRYAKEARIPIGEEVPTPEKPVGPEVPEGYTAQKPGEMFSGEAYRSPSGFVQSARTALDVLEFESSQLGNKQAKIDALAAAKQHGVDLTTVPSNRILWVTRSEEDAKLYGGDVEPVHIPKGSIVLTDIGPDGVLVLLNPKKLKLLRKEIPPYDVPDELKGRVVYQAAKQDREGNLQYYEFRIIDKDSPARDFNISLLPDEDLATKIKAKEEQVAKTKEKPAEAPAIKAELDEEAIKESLQYIRDYPDLVGLLDEDALKGLLSRGLVTQTPTGDHQLTEAGLNLLGALPPPIPVEQPAPPEEELPPLPQGYRIQPVAGKFDIYDPNDENVGTRPTKQAAIAYAGAHAELQAKEGKAAEVAPKPKAKPKRELKPFDPIRLHRELTKRNKSLPILNDIFVKNGKMYSSDLVVVAATDTKLKDGFYKFVGSELVADDEFKEEGWPISPEVKGKVTVELPGRTAIAKAITFASDDELRPAMTGVQVEIDKGKVKYISTDGYRLYQAILDLPNPEQVKEKIDFILPAGLVDLFAKDKSTESFTLRYDPAKDKAQEVLSISTPQYTLTSRPIEERFPNYHSVLISDHQKSFRLDKRQFVEALKTISPFADKETKGVVISESVTETGAPGLKLTASDEERKVSKSVIVPVETLGPSKVHLENESDYAFVMPRRLQEPQPPDLAAFHIDYLLDAVGVLSGPDNPSEDLYIYHSTPEQAHTFTDRPIGTGAVVKAKAPAREKGSIEEEENPRRALREQLYLFLSEGAVVTISNKKLFDTAEYFFKSKLSAGKWSVKDAYDILEAALNQLVIEKARQWLSMSFGDALAAIKKFTDRLPTQRTRTGEQEDFQQYSTPPELGLLAASVANATAADVALEPSAGAGGLAAFLKAMGATVYVNEIAPRRVELLRDLGFENVTQVDAEFLNDLLPDEIKPTLVLMNPPFSSTGGRVAPSSKFGAKHVSQALLRLVKNGRLVALIGNGMAIDKEKFREWWRDIASKYNIRADISLSGELYKKFGTTFDLDLIVIDNTGPTPGENFVEQVQNVVLGEPKTLEEAYDMLKEIADERPRIEKVAPGEGEVGAGRGAKPGERGGPVRGKRGKPGGRRGEVGPEEGVGGAPEGGAKPGLPKPPEGEGPGRGRGAGEGAAGGVRPIADILKDIGKNFRDVFGKPGGKSLQAGVPLDPVKMEDFFQRTKPQFQELWVAVGRDIEKFIEALKQYPRKLVEYIAKRFQEEEAKPKPIVEFEPPKETRTFAPYKPSRLRDDRLQPHPGPIVETLSMASVPMPEITYKSALPDVVLKQGDISDIQFESVIYAGQRHSMKLPDGSRAGFFIGDGTGVGKGRENAAVILDNWLQGRKKSLWVSPSWDLFEDAIRDVNDLMQHLDFKIPLTRFDEYGIKEDIDVKEGILFTTYSTLITISKVDGHKRIDQVKKWLGKEPVMVFDEAHYAKNLVAVGGLGEPVKRALAVFQIQNDIPDARVLYSSATGATDVRNMAYMTRLGLWGPGTSFPDGFEQFMSDIEHRGVGAMEMVSRDMKALGMYISRTISFDGVEYREAVHELTPDQLKMYNKAAKLWQTIAARIEDAIEATNSSKWVRQLVLRAFWNANQRFFRQLLMAFKVPTLMKVVDAEVRNTNSIVIGLISTSEARDKEAVAKAAADGRELDDLDFTPRETIQQWIDKVFPINTFIDVPDPANPGKTIKEMLMDEDGNPVVNKEAKAIQDKLSKLVSDVDLPNSAINQFILKYGPDSIAELTGRVRRLERDEETGKIVYATRAREGISQKMVSVTENKAFQSGQKRIAMISDKASQGISLHSDNRAQNKQRRVHITLETGWSADKQLQQFGRTHRTDQAVPPVYVLLSTNVSGERRFISTIAKRLESLGALTKGQREATTSGDLVKYNLESIYGETALMSLYTKLLSGEDFPTLPSQEGVDTLKDMGIVDREENTIKKSDLTNVERFLNRLLTVSVAAQNNLFEAYWQEFQDIVESAKAAGTFDEGVVDLKADNIKITRSSVIHVDETTKAETKHYQLAVTEKTNPVAWERIVDMMKKALPDEGLYTQEVSGNFVYIVKAGDRTDPETGIVSRTYRKMTPRDSAAGYIDQNDLYDKYRKVKTDKAEQWWKDQFNSAPKTRVREHHLIAGAILPLWNKLRASNFSRAKVLRVKTDENQRIVGLSIPTTKVAAVLRALGIQRKFADLDPAKVYEMVMNGYEFPLAGGLVLMRKKLHGEERVELVNVQSESFRRMQDMGLLMERIEWKYRFFVPSDEAGTEVVRKLFKDHPPMDVDANDMLDNTEDTSAPQLAPVSFALGVGQQPPDEGATTRAIPRKADSLNRIKPIEFMELVEIAHDLTGHYPGLKGWKRARGMFYGVENGYIKLHYNLFKKGNENYVASVLGHELGHLTDWLPDKTLKRGNLLGHLLTMRSFMLETFGNTKVTNEEIRKELLAVTHYLSPYDEAQVPKWYNRYRHSAKELYADAFSLLVLSPGELERIAPKWYSVFFDSLDRKPDVKQEFFEMMARLSGDPFEIQRVRHERTLEMFQRGSARRDQIEVEKKAHGRKWVMDFRMAFGNFFRPIEKKFWTGEPTPPEDSPIHYFDQLAYVDTAVNLYLYDVQENIIKLVHNSGLSVTELGLYMLHRRIANGDRGEMANPLGFAPADSEKQLDFLREKYGDDKFDVLKEAGKRYNDMLFRLSEEAVELGIYSKKAFEEKVKPNKDYYATFSILDYIRTNHISPMIKLQVGTLKELENPFEATVMKTVGLIRLIHLQRAKISLRDHLRKEFPKEIIRARTVKTFTGKYVAAAPPNSWMKPFFMLEDGHLVAYHVDPYIAEASEVFADLGLLTNISLGLDFVTNNIFKPIVLTYNLGFALFFNPIRDFWRNYKLLPIKSPLTLIRYYLDAMPQGYRHLKTKEISGVVREMMENHAYAVPFNEYDFDDRYDDYAATLKHLHVRLETGKLDRFAFVKKVLFPIVWLFRFLKLLGSTAELMSKIAGFTLRKELLGETGNVLSYNTRNYTGTPNFRVKGKYTGITNTLFTFSNITFEGIKADWRISTNPKTASGYWVKWTISTALPKLFMAAAVYGLFGDDLKKFFKKVTSYDLTNYLILPWGFTEKGDAAYFRLPTDQAGQFWGAILWKLLMAPRQGIQTVTQVFGGITGYLAPSVNPFASVPIDWLSFLSGANPYDYFRGRYIVADRLWKAGGKYAFWAMVKHTLNEFGFSQFTVYDDGTKTTTETMLQVTPLISRALKITSYGEQEHLRREYEEVEKTRIIEKLQREGPLAGAVRRELRGRTEEFTVIVEEWAQGIVNKDHARRKEAIARLQQYNRESAAKIMPDDIMRSVLARVVQLRGVYKETKPEIMIRRELERKTE